MLRKFFALSLACLSSLCVSQASDQFYDSSSSRDSDLMRDGGLAPRASVPSFDQVRSGRYAGSLTYSPFKEKPPRVGQDFNPPQLVDRKMSLKRKRSELEGS